MQKRPPRKKSGVGMAKLFFPCDVLCYPLSHPPSPAVPLLCYTMMPLRTLSSPSKVTEYYTTAVLSRQAPQVSHPGKSFRRGEVG